MVDENKVGVDRFKVEPPVKASPQTYEKAVEALSEDGKEDVDTMTIPVGRDIKKERKQWKQKKSAILKKR